jgi:peroxin-11B
MRLGKPLEHLQAALRAATDTGPMGEQITAISRQLAYAGYLAYDSIIWVSRPDIHIHFSLDELSISQANSVKFVYLSKNSKERIGKISNRFWLAGILFNLIHALLKV